MEEKPIEEKPLYETDFEINGKLVVLAINGPFNDMYLTIDGEGGEFDKKEFLAVLQKFIDERM